MDEAAVLPPLGHWDNKVGGKRRGRREFWLNRSFIADYSAFISTGKDKTDPISKSGSSYFAVEVDLNEDQYGDCGYEA